MINKQTQSVGHNSTAVVSQGDTTINQGLSPDQLRAIIECVADQIPKFAAIAGQVVDDRMKQFEAKIVERFEKDKEANPEVFKDPDFLFSVREAQVAYARLGEDRLGENLADLIAERSQFRTRSRSSLILNDAIKKVSLLTKDELSLLSIAFILQRTQLTSSTKDKLTRYLGTNVIPLLADLPSDEGSATYLETIGCGRITNISHTELDALLANTYAFLRHGVDKAAVKSQIGEDAVNSLTAAGFIDCDSENRIKSCLGSHEDLKAALLDAGMDHLDADEIWNVLRGSNFSRIEVIEALRGDLPEIEALLQRWDESGLKAFIISPIGIAIAHANVKRHYAFPTPLSVWLG